MLGAHIETKEYFARFGEVINQLSIDQIRGLADDIHAAWDDGRFVFICGNGGSGSNSSAAFGSAFCDWLEACEDSEVSASSDDIDSGSADSVWSDDCDAACCDSLCWPS